jgi:dienelactone hydrolase
VLPALMAVIAVAACGTARAAPGGSRGAAAGPARVLSRTLNLARGVDRPLTTTVWFTERITGRHPVILLSHGLGGRPAQFAPIATGWARAGYIVLAPAYPHTRAGVRVDRRDIVNQPADAAYVLDRVRALDRAGGAAPAGHVDGARVAVVGFSAGGTTTLGLLRRGHDPALRAAVSIAGRRPAVPFGGRAVPTLFVHGDRDPVVPIAAGREAFAAMRWPDRQFVTMPGEGHGQYLNPGDPGYVRASAAILDFLTARVPVAG